jgi:hypothetical protein
LLEVDWDLIMINVQHFWNTLKGELLYIVDEIAQLTMFANIEVKTNLFCPQSKPL